MPEPMRPRVQPLLGLKPAWLVIGSINILIAAAGLVMALLALPGVTNFHNTEELPFRLQAYIAMTAISVVLAVSIGFSGGLLLRADPRGLFLANFAFAIEITYGRLVGLLWRSSQYGRSIGYATGVGNMALVWWDKYPIGALLVMNFIAWLAVRLVTSATQD